MQAIQVQRSSQQNAGSFFAVLPFDQDESLAGVWYIKETLFIKTRKAAALLQPLSKKVC